MFGVVVFTLGDIIALIAGLAILAVIALIALIALALRAIGGILNIVEKILRRGMKEDENESNG